MQYDTTTHRQNIVDAYQARLRALELQIAQFGPHCPSHVHAEMEFTRSQLSEFQKHTANTPENVKEGNTHKKFVIPVKVIYVGVVLLVVIIIVIGGTFMYLVRLTDNQELRELGTITKSQSSDFVSYKEPMPQAHQALPDYETLSLVCATDAVLLEGAPGMIRARSTRLDNLSLQKMPIGSRLYFECMSPTLGQVIMVIVRYSIEVRGDLEAIWIVELYRCRR